MEKVSDKAQLARWRALHLISTETNGETNVWIESKSYYKHSITQKYPIIISLNYQKCKEWWQDEKSQKPDCSHCYNFKQQTRRAISSTRLNEAKKDRKTHKRARRTQEEVNGDGEEVNGDVVWDWWFCCVTCLTRLDPTEILSVACQLRSSWRSIPAIYPSWGIRWAINHNHGTRASGRISSLRQTTVPFGELM